MDQKKIGAFIAQKRKEKSLTQEQLAEKLGITNKAVSKWENGKCMPDIAIIQSLCEELGITVNELLNGEENNQSAEPVISLLWLVERMKKVWIIIMGLILCILPDVLNAIVPMADTTNMSTIALFFQGLVDGVFTGVKIVGVGVVMYGVVCYFREKAKSEKE